MLTWHSTAQKDGKLIDGINKIAVKNFIKIYGINNSQCLVAFDSVHSIHYSSTAQSTWACEMSTGKHKQLEENAALAGLS